MVRPFDDVVEKKSQTKKKIFGTRTYFSLGFGFQIPIINQKYAKIAEIPWVVFIFIWFLVFFEIFAD